MKLRTWKNFFKEALQNIFRNKVMSLASIIAIMSALFILGVILILVFNLDHIAGDMESKVEITIFLDKSASYNRSKAVMEEIKALDGVFEVEYVSKEEGLAKWKDDLGEQGDLLDGYDENTNPLPDKLILRIEKPDYVDNIISKTHTIPEVDKVNYSKEVIDTISSVVRTTRTVGLWLVLLLIVIAMIIINNTVKITVHSRRREINTMKYIGATNSYIRWPFIIEGFSLGFFASIIAGVIVIGGYSLLLGNSGFVGGYSFMGIFKLLPLESILYQIGAIFLLLGSGVGIIASIFSVQRYLKV